MHRSHSSSQEASFANIARLQNLSTGTESRHNSDQTLSGNNTTCRRKTPTLLKHCIKILESLWTQGMQNCSTDENKLKIQQASVVKGLVGERTKSWIYSRNRKKRRDDEGQSKAKKSCSTASNARVSTEDIIQNVSEKMSQDDTEEVNSECSTQGQEVLGQDSLSSDEEMNRTTESDKDSQQGTASRLIQSVEGKVQELQSFNCDVIVLVYNHSSRCPSTTGTLKGLDFLSSQNPGIDLQFAAALSVSSCDYALN